MNIESSSLILNTPAAKANDPINNTERILKETVAKSDNMVQFIIYENLLQFNVYHLVKFLFSIKVTLC